MNYELFVELKITLIKIKYAFTTTEDKGIRQYYLDLINEGERLIFEYGKGDL